MFCKVFYNRVVVHNTEINVYDLSRYITISGIVNGVSAFSRFTPDTMVQLLTFEDGSAINLSYLLSGQAENYDDVKIRYGSYRAE